MRKKVLLTTIPVENIALTARVERRGVPLGTPAECFAAANNIEYINGFTLPNYATRFLQANLPSIDVLEYPTWDEYRAALANGYDVVGISFWTYTAREAAAMAEMARQAGAVEVWGGGHGVNTPGIAGCFDRVFRGYSEYQLKMLLEGEELRTFHHPVLDSQYDFHLGDVKTGYLFSIRGCQMGCSFCSGPRYYERLAFTPIEEVEALLDAYRERGVRHVTVVDETFLQNVTHGRKVIQALRARQMTWTCTSRVDVLLKHLDELQPLGLRNVYIGIESMDDRSLASVRKGIQASKTEALLRRLEAYGCYAFGTYMLCLENDTIDSVKAGVERLAAFPALYGVVFWIATPFPGTDFYDEVEAAGGIIDREPKHYDALHLVRRHAAISPAAARDLLVYCVRHHCHEQNLRKRKILRRWEKLEARPADLPPLPAEPPAPPVDWRQPAEVGA